MEKYLEESLFQAVKNQDLDTVSALITKGANPNTTVGQGKTCLGEAANIGNIDIIRILLGASDPCSISSSHSRKHFSKGQKRKIKHEGENTVKCRSLNDRTYNDNQGYFVFVHGESSSSEEIKKNVKTPLTPLSLTPSPEADLEWDEDIGNVAPTTSEDETWSSMYKWYASKLESTGAAITSALLVTNGINQQDAFSRTALHYAAEQGHADVVKLLIEAGCKLDIVASDGLTPLHVAVLKNNVEIVMLLLAAGSNVNYKTHEKMTPLHFAATRGFNEMIKILIKNGACVEARDSNERTALYLAAGRGHVDIVKYLISRGANVNGEEIHGYTPLCEAVWQKYPSVVKLLLSYGARVTHSHRLIHNAIIHRQEEIVNLLTCHGGGINLHNDYGDTPLIIATRLAQINIMKILLQKGANVNSYNNITGASALHAAVDYVDDSEIFEEILKCLLEHKIDINATTLTGDTALNRALLLQKDHAVVHLVRYGADVNSSGQMCGLDNLSIASKRKTNDLASLILKAGHYQILFDDTCCSHCEWLHRACRNPLNLSDLCRIRIRALFKNRILFKCIFQLPLPSSLKRFLMMEDEGIL